MYAVKNKNHKSKRGPLTLNSLLFTHLQLKDIPPLKLMASVHHNKCFRTADGHYYYCLKQERHTHILMHNCCRHQFHCLKQKNTRKQQQQQHHQQQQQQQQQQRYTHILIHNCCRQLLKESDINEMKNMMRCRDSRSAKAGKQGRDDSMKQFNTQHNPTYLSTLKIPVCS